MRIHPRRPKVGVRASAPNEIWHIDASKVRLVDDTVVWVQLKHRWLYLHDLDTVAALQAPIATFVEDYNVLIPRAALGGRTPDEVLFGCEEDLLERLAVARRQACVERVQFNQARASCGGCDGPGRPSSRGEAVDG